MTPKDQKDMIESFEDRLKDLRVHQVYLSQMINSLNQKNEAARSWMTDNRKKIILAYNQLNDKIENGLDQDIAAILESEHKKIEGARPKIKSNSVHCRIKTEDGKTYDFDFEFNGRIPVQGAFMAALRQMDTGLEEKRLREVYENAKRVVLTDRRVEFTEETFETSVQDQLDKLDDADLKIITQLHDRRPLPKPTADLHSIWGVILDIEHKGGMRASTRILEEFSKNKKLSALVEGFQLGVPQSIFNEIDENTRRNIEDSQSSLLDQDTQSNWWGRITGKEDREYKEAIAETKTELLSVENNPAFAKAMNESLFDWIEAMTLETGAEEYPAPETHDHLLEQYKQADFVIRIAQNDFNETLRSFTDMIVDEANQYVQFTTALKDLSKDQNLAIIEGQMQRDNYKDFLSWVLEDTKHNSLTELAYAQLGASYSAVKTFKLLEKHTNEKPLELLFPNDDLVSDSAKKLLSKFLPLTLKKKASPDLIDTTISTLRLVIEKSGASFENALTESKALEKVYKSSLSQKDQELLVQTILHYSDLHMDMLDLENINDEDFSLKRDAKILDDIRSAIKLLNGYTRRNIWDAETKGDFEKIYGIAKMLSPDTDILKLYLDNENAPNAADIFMTLWKNGVSHNTTPSEEIFHQVLTNALDNKEWENIVPEFYTVDDPQFVADLRKFMHSGTPLNMFDRFYKTGDSAKINAVLSFLESPVERANFYQNAADKTNDTDLKKEYLKNVSELDGDYIEYKNGHLINPAEMTTIFYTGETEGPTGKKDVGVHVTANGHLYKLPGFKDAAHASEFFQAVSRRDNLIVIGNEYMNPQKFDYLDVNEDSEGRYVEILHKKYPTKIFLNDDETIEETLKNITDKNPNLMEINGNSLINLNSLTQVFFDDENNAYFINGDTCLVVLELDDAQQKALVKNLKQIDSLKNIGAHFINISAIDGIAHNAETGELTLQAVDTVYNGRNKIRPFKESFARFVLPPITIDQDQYDKMVKILKDNGFVQNEEEDMFVNSNRLTIVNIEEFQNTLTKKFTLHFDGSKMALQTQASDPKFKLNLQKAADMTEIDGTLITANKVSNVSQSTTSKTYVSAGSNATTVMARDAKDKKALEMLANNKSKMVFTGIEAINPAHIEAAFAKTDTTIDVTFINQDNCTVETRNLTETFNAVQGNTENTMAGKTRRRSPELTERIKRWSTLAKHQQRMKSAGANLVFATDNSEKNAEIKKSAKKFTRGLKYGKY